MYEGKRLQEFRCLKYYNIKDASQIYFVNDEYKFIFIQNKQGMANQHLNPKVDIICGV